MYMYIYIMYIYIYIYIYDIYIYIYIYMIHIYIHIYIYIYIYYILYIYIYIYIVGGGILAPKSKRLPATTRGAPENSSPDEPVVGRTTEYTCNDTMGHGLTLSRLRWYSNTNLFLVFGRTTTPSRRSPFYGQGPA